MNKINVLSEHVANLISAGEVVERPVNVVKELVENSIDALSSDIRVDLIDCGIKKIVVLDNGFGMTKGEIPLAILRHATSKISDEQDLFRIASLGFRGEALPSIASVSKMRITSSTDGQSGYYFEYHAGTKINEGLCAHPKGTQIEVNNLFYNTPARYKHLKSSYQELSLIIDYIYKAALSHSNIAFQLVNNDKTLFKTMGRADIKEIICESYGNNIMKSLINFDARNTLYHIDGFITNNEVFRSNRSAITVIINGRVIKNNNLIYAICDAYQTILPVGKYPIAVLFINCDPALIDVNVHPSKLEVRITDETILKELVTKTIKGTLLDSELLKYQKVERDNVVMPEIENHVVNSEENNSHNLLHEDLIWEMFGEVNDTTDTEKLPTTDRFFNETNVKKVGGIPSEITATEEYKQPSLSIDNRAFFNKLQYIGQFHETYLILAFEDFLYIIDQHAAMERVMYEKITEVFKKEHHETYDLLLPITIDFSTQEISLIENVFDDLSKMGISAENFGGNTIIFRTIPTWIPQNLEIEFLSDIINHLISGKITGKAKMYDSLAKSLSCKKSIKAGMTITEPEVKQLLSDLDRCIMPYTCPHGRPTLVKFSNYELEKMFKRVI